MKSSTTESKETRTPQIRSANSARPSTASVVQETAAVEETASAPAEATPEVPLCPRCGGKLTNPEGLGWCPSCGYCRSLEQDAKKAALATPAKPRGPSPLGI